MCDTLIYNGTIVTVDAAFRIIPDGLVAFSDGKIRRVEARDRSAPLPEAGRMVDAGGGIIMPGLVNTHTHMPMSIFRGLADDLPLEVWLNAHIFPAEATHINPQSVRTGALLSCAEMLLSGTTTCCDGYFLEDHVARAVQEAGIRAVVGQGVIDFPAPGVPDPKKNVAHAVEFVEKWQGRTPLITPSIFCHSPYTCGPDTLTAAKAAARDAGILFQIHLSETKSEAAMVMDSRGSTPVRHLEALGLLDGQTLLVHMVWADDDNTKRVKNAGAGISHNPESNMKLAAGVAPVPGFLDAGIPVGLGTDGCASNNNLDLFQEMDVVAKLHKVWNSDPTVTDAETVLKMATIDGARAIGLGHAVGSLETGKQADIVIIDTHQPHLTPIYHPVSHLVYAVRGADVRDVWVGGRPVVRDRRLRTLDVDEVMDQAVALAERIRGS